MVVALGGEIRDGSGDKQAVTSVTTCHILTRAACDATKDFVFDASWGMAGIFRAQRVGVDV